MDELGIGLASVQVVQVCVVDLVAGEEEASLLQEVSWEQGIEKKLEYCGK